MTDAELVRDAAHTIRLLGLKLEDATLKANADAMKALASRLESGVIVPRELLEDLRKRADQYYCDSLDKARQPECLGWEAKVKAGTFGPTEMYAHGEMNALDGRHRGMYEVLNAITRAMLQAQEADDG